MNTQTLTPGASVPANENGERSAEIRHSEPIQPSGIAEPRSRFQLLTVEELEKRPPARWMIDGILPENGLAVLYGASGAGKTFLALDLALCVASGTPWHGREVTKGPVVYICAEATQGILQRIQAWRQEHRGDLKQFRTILGSLAMCEGKDVRELIAEISKAPLNPVLVVIDTLARCFGDGDENAQKDMNAFVRGCDAIKVAFSKCTVLVVHHTGKDGKDRGSSVLRGAADTMLKLNRKSTNAVTTLECDKQKDEEPLRPIRLALTRKAVADGHTSCVLELATGAVDTAPCGPRVAQSDKQALDTLATFDPAGTTHNEWRKASALAKSTFKSVRERLIASGRVVKDGSVYRIAPAGSGLEQGRNQVA